jgi:hypothetical protein
MAPSLNQVTKLIFKELPLSSLLNLRETCRATKDWVDHSKNKPLMAEKLKYTNEIRLWVDGNSMDRFVRFLQEVPNLPFPNFYLGMSSSVKNYDDPNFIRFRDQFGPHIRQLDISCNWKFVTEGEWDFYESLTSLEHLTIYKVRSLGQSSATPRVPSCFQRLQSITILHN